MEEYLCHHFAHLLASGADPSLGEQQYFVEYFFARESSHEVLQKTHYTFQKRSLFLQAMTHSSFAHEFHSFPLPHNETLEFLGDAILNAVISSELYQRYPHQAEGELSKFRGALVNEFTLYMLAQQLGLGKCLLLGRGEIKNGGMNSPGSLSNCWEALVGAIYLDGGFSAAEKVIAHLYSNYRHPDSGLGLYHQESMGRFDSKSLLQEKTMALYKCLPEYLVLEENKQAAGPGPLYEVGLFIKGIEICRAVERSKKQAQKLLATKALQEKLYLKLS